MTIKYGKFFLYFFIFLTACLQNVSAQKEADKQKSETPENLSVFTLNNSDQTKDSSIQPINFSRTNFETAVNDFRYNFLGDAVKKNGKFVTAEYYERLNRASTFSNMIVVSEKDESSGSCKNTELN